MTGTAAAAAGGGAPIAAASMGYWGCQTKGNRMAWAFIALFAVLGLAFWIPGALQYRRCVSRLTACVCTQRGDAVRCLDPMKEGEQRMILECRAQLQQCRRTPIVVWALGWLFLVAFTWLPCFYFCCCSKGPAYATQGANGVQMSTAQPYGTGPDAHYSTHPFATQPYGPMPYYSSGQQQQQQPCPAYPVSGQTIGYPVNGTPPRPNGPGNVPVNSY